VLAYDTLNAGLPDLAQRELVNQLVRVLFLAWSPPAAQNQRKASFHPLHLAGRDRACTEQLPDRCRIVLTNITCTASGFALCCRRALMPGA
jgi:hypothetical protein